MKKRITFWVSGLMSMILASNITFAQKYDEERMTRDIEVAENVLATLIKQELSQHRMFGLDIKGTYQPGYGVTFRLPGDYMGPMVFTIQGAGGDDNMPVIYNDGQSYSYSYRTTTKEDDGDGEKDGDLKLKDKSKRMKKVNADSVRDTYNQSVIKAAKDFVIDYGDFISQLGPNEKIVVTNRGTQSQWVHFGGNQTRTHLSIEALKSDISAFRQGKLSRDQALGKVKVVNTESVSEKLPDIEMLSSIFNRLYRADLSKTYFTENMVSYEFLKDYGVIYYMNVFSSNESDYKRYSMPTLGLDDVDKETRDKKVIELYPKFEKELKENILEYGRTLKSLKDDEVLIFNVTLTKCKGCGIPESIELTIKASALRDYGTGKIDQNAALSKFTLKRGANQ